MNLIDILEDNIPTPAYRIAMLRDNAENMVKSMELMKNTPNLYLMPFNYIARMSDKVDNDEVTCDDVVKVLDEYKAEIISYLLRELKRGTSSLPTIGNHINRLHKLKITWPELDVINRSIESEFEANGYWKSHVNESYDNQIEELHDDIESIVRTINYLKDNPFWNSFPLNTLSRFHNRIRNNAYTTTDVKEALETIKIPIITYLLREIKNKNSIDFDILHYIKDIHSFGIKWPELDAIIKSYEADKLNKGLVENSESNEIAKIKNNPFDIRNIRNPSEQLQLFAVSLAGDVIQYIKNPTEKVQLAAVNKNPFDIKYIINPSEEVQLAAVKQNILLIFTNINFLDIVYQTYKTNIIKCLLTEISIREFRDVLYKIDMLQDKVNWPELNIIKNSAEHEVFGKFINENSFNNEARYSEKDNVLNKFSRLLDQYLIDDVDISELLKKITNTVISPELKVKILKNKTAILTGLRVIIVDGLYYKFIDICTWLKSNGIDWDELNLEHFRKIIIRSILIRVKIGANSGYFYSSILSNIRILRELGIYWPELNTIQISVEAAIMDEKKKHLNIDDND
jgi:hypothetical protein